MSKMEGEILVKSLEMWETFYGNPPKVKQVIDFIHKTYGLNNVGLFKNLKVEEKNKKELKGLAGNYIFYNDPFEL